MAGPWPRMVRNARYSARTCKLTYQSSRDYNILMRKTIMVPAVILLLLSLSCAHEYTRPEAGGAVFRPVTPGETAELMGTREDLLIVDTRTGWERSSGWIANSVHISYFDFILGGGYDRIERNVPVLLVCAHGVRSYRVGRALVKKGWLEVYDLEGGMKAWIKEGYPVVGGKE